MRTNVCPVSFLDRVRRHALAFFAIACLVAVASFFGRSVAPRPDGSAAAPCLRKEMARFDREMAALRREIEDAVARTRKTDGEFEEIAAALRDAKAKGGGGGKARKAKATEPEACECSDEEAEAEAGRESDVARALGRFDADRTGKADFALESAGGSIATVRGTEAYPAAATVSFLGVPLCPASNGPRTMINPGNLPGECWAFKGSKGTAVVRLLGAVRVSSISLEHIRKTMSPTREISTAPKEFSLVGLKNVKDKDGESLGKFTYNIDGPPIQEFKVNTKNVFNFIEFNVHSNNGNPKFTCVYRLRVHGKLENK